MKKVETFSKMIWEKILKKITDYAPSVENRRNTVGFEF